MTPSNRIDHIRLTSHPAPGAKLRFPIHWGAPTARERGPVIGTVSRPGDRNVIGTHGGSYALYRALAVSSGALDPIRRPDLTNTHPAATIGPFPQWTEPQRIVSLDPWGHLVAEKFKPRDRRRHRHPPEHRHHQGAARSASRCSDALAAGRLKADGDVVHANGSVVGDQDRDRSGLVSARHRRALRHHRERICAAQLFEQTAGMFPELVTRPDLQVFLPPIGGITVYLFGDIGQAARSAHQDHLPRA